MNNIRFNQDATCFVVSPKDNSVSIYNCDPFGKCFELVDVDTQSNNDSLTQHDSNGVLSSGSGSDILVEMLFSTNLVAIANRTQGLPNSRKLKVVNTKRKSSICELSFPHAILDVVMNRKRMCVLLESDQIFIYDISCMKHLQTIDIWDHHSKSTPVDVKTSSINGSSLNSGIDDVRNRSNSAARVGQPKIALSYDDRSILAFSSYSSGRSTSEPLLLNDIVIYDALNVIPINYLNYVHKGHVVSLAISSDGKMITTASEKGTVVRVFNTGVDSQSDLLSPLMYEFRRGNRPSNLFQLAFNSDSTLIGCVGNSDTIHIFKLDVQNMVVKGDLTESDSLITADDIKALRNDVNAKQFSKLLSKTIKRSLPSQALRRDHAHITLKNAKIKYSIGFPKEFPDEIYVAGSDGNFSIFSLPSKSGECILSKRNIMK